MQELGLLLSILRAITSLILYHLLEVFGLVLQHVSNPNILWNIRVFICGRFSSVGDYLLVLTLTYDRRLLQVLGCRRFTAVQGSELLGVLGGSPLFLLSKHLLELSLVAGLRLL